MSESLEQRVVAAVGHQYALESEIGRGGMSVVYRARDIRLNRQIALKVLPPELAYDPAVRMRFTREAQTGAQLSHSHIVPIYDVGERDGLAYFVMAFVSGGSLAALLAREPRQPPDEARRIICEIADALAYAHERGVIHRDIKPDNILIDANTGRVLVTDFGIARAMEAGTRLTATGIAVGTPTYMSPEQAEGDREIDGRSDIYSLGVVAYQMLTGRVPFTGGNSLALLLKHVTERPRPIVELCPDAPRVLRDAIERALMKSPEDRWPSASALREALMSGDVAPAWRAERREPVRYTSPLPESRLRDRGTSPRESGRAESRSAPAKRGGTGAGAGSAVVSRKGTREIVMEQPHFAALTEEQRKDLTLWFGRLNLRERVRIARWYGFFTLAAWFPGMAALAAIGDFPPAALYPLLPIFMTRKLWQRGKSLRAHGLRLRRVFLMPLLRWVIPKPPPPPTNQQLSKLASKEVLESPHGAVIRRAAEDRAAIMDIVGKLPTPDRALIPDVEPTVKALVDRVAHLAATLHSLEQSIDHRALEAIEARIAVVERDVATPEGERRLAMLRRQHATMEDLVRRRDTLARQLDTAGLALGNLRLDLIKLRSTGIESALSDVSTATQEARALSREIDGVLHAATELRQL
ncbi:MAG: protein kinase domain-containing protein [Gemmatimonadaceae bacterium]